MAERITFAVGAEETRLQAAIDIARANQPGPLSLGAYINAVAHPDMATARQLVRGRPGTYARFSTMDRGVLNTLPEGDRAVAENLASGYDLSSHSATGARHAAAITDEFVDRFGVVGPSERVAERFARLAALGLDHFVIAGLGRDVSYEVLAESSQSFGREVIPRVKATVSAVRNGTHTADRAPPPEVHLESGVNSLPWLRTNGSAQVFAVRSVSFALGRCADLEATLRAERTSR